MARVEIQRGDPLADRPRMIKVEGDLSELRLRLPRRASSDPRTRYRVLIGVVLVNGVAICGSWAVQLPGARLDSWVALVVVGFTLVATVAPYLAWALLHRSITDKSRITLTQHLLRVEGKQGLELPLEEVRDVELVPKGDRGLLRFHTLHGPVDLCDGLFEHELQWVRRVVLHNTEQRRLELGEEGYDVDAVTRAPEALQDLMER